MYLLIKGRLHIILLKRLLFQGTFHLEFISMFSFHHFNMHIIFHFVLRTNTNGNDRTLQMHK